MMFIGMQTENEESDVDAIGMRMKMRCPIDDRTKMIIIANVTFHERRRR